MPWQDMAIFSRKHLGIRCDSTNFSPVWPLCRRCCVFPALTDFTVMMKGSSYMFLTGPKVVKTVTGEDVTQEDLGGAQVHASKSGVAHFAVESEEDGIELLRDLLSYLPQNNMEEPPHIECSDPIDRLEDSLNEIIPDSPNKPYNMYDIIHNIVDYGKFLEVHKDYATNIITGLLVLTEHL